MVQKIPRRQKVISENAIRRFKEQHAEMLKAHERQDHKHISEIGTYLLREKHIRAVWLLITVASLILAITITSFLFLLDVAGRQVAVNIGLAVFVGAVYLMWASNGKYQKKVKAYLKQKYTPQQLDDVEGILKKSGYL